MKRKPSFPLMAKMLLWLLVHLCVLAGAFVVFVGWQLQLGLDSLLSGSSGERLKTLGTAVTSELRESPREEWPGILEVRSAGYGVEAMLVLEEGKRMLIPDGELPEDISERVREHGQRPRPRPDAGPPRGPGPGLEREPRPRPPRDTPPAPDPRPIFLARSSDDGGYWAGIDLPLFRPGVDRPLHGVLLLRSGDPSAAGLFFDLRPWLLGGLAVLALSLLLWAPFVISITRYTRRLSRATEQIARGNFSTRIGGRRRDELGIVGESIEHMADRLDHLLRGQKRFLGDVAHELCSPLARVRTGLGILENRLGPESRERLESIEEDVAELSDLVAEVLAFTRAETAPESVAPEPLELQALVRQSAERECPAHDIEWAMPEGLQVRADRRLLARAIGNILRNASVHGGEDCRIRVRASRSGAMVVLSFEDNGPGVPTEEAQKLFEPFYRPDGARTRESGGTGLGLAIVRSAIQACGGTIRAEASELGGLGLRIELPGA